MPWFTKPEHKSQSKRRNLFGRSTTKFTGFPSPYPNPVRQSSQVAVTQSSKWQAHPFSQGQWPARIPRTQTAPQPYPYLPVYASSPQLPGASSQPRLPLRQAHGQPMLNATVNRTTDYLNRGAALCDQVASKFNDVISLMDQGAFTGNEQDLQLTYPQFPAAIPPAPYPRFAPGPVARGVPSRALTPTSKNVASRSTDRVFPQNVLTTNNVFEKATMYANSRLPPDLPPFRVYIPTWPVICLAARYSMNAYRTPSGAEKDAYVDADWRVGTKAMVIKSVPIDDMNTVVFAIRGTQTFMDWAVNLNTATVSPVGFLDDRGNLCHAGFLDVARKMIKPVAARLRQLLEENPNRSSCSLVITGHSAGGAVASLLFCHMLSTTMKSELNILTDCFKRVHCVTFGAPPVSLLPLSRPAGQAKKSRKNLFLSFINEGDPVSRADKAYVRSLLELYVAQPPDAAKSVQSRLYGTGPLTSKPSFPAGLWNSKVHQTWGLSKRRKSDLAAAAAYRSYSNAAWRIPSATLSNAGRLVVLRVPLNEGNDGVRAFVTTDEMLRGVVYGDPLMHQMKLYFRRIETLATKAATAR